MNVQRRYIMRILIADDEELTRKGIISSIDWDSLGITQIDSADDGVNALSYAQKAAPDILLTDVRMPRMDGIELSKRLRELVSDCPIIFMSGYSDKEYLKAAINLKAVSYVEKPFTPDDITQALTEAVSLVQKQQLQRESNQFFEQEASSKLALALTQAGGAVHEQSELPFHHNQYFTTLILSTGEQMLHMPDADRSALFAAIRKQLDGYHMSELHTMKHTAYVILHLYGSKKQPPQTLVRICKYIRDLLRNYAISQFHLVLGDTVKGDENIYISYNSAVLLLQSAFFTPYETILHPYEEGHSISVTYMNEFPTRLRDALSKRDQAQALALCDELSDKLQNNRGLLPNQARDLYYKLLMVISNLQYDAKVSTASDASTISPLEKLNDCMNYSDVHQLLTKAVNNYFTLLETAVTENSTLFLIKDYISKNYSDSNLSIKDISDHVHLSSSYLCTVFKTETGQTLNQYLTNFRMEKAKQLLSDPRNKISEIAASVGYGDQNYFGKTFKKVVGLSPSEYREKESL